MGDHISDHRGWNKELFALNQPAAAADCLWVGRAQLGHGNACARRNGAPVIAKQDGVSVAFIRLWGRSLRLTGCNRNGKKCCTAQQQRKHDQIWAYAPPSKAAGDFSADLHRRSPSMRAHRVVKRDA